MERQPGLVAAHPSLLALCTHAGDLVGCPVNQPLSPALGTRMLGPAPFQQGVIYGRAMNPPLVACVELFM